MCRIQPIPEEDIVNEDNLWRRIHPSFIVRDDNRNCFRPTRQAFTDESMSVYLERIHLEHGGTPESALDGYVGYFIAAINVSLARECNQRVFHDPIENNLGHSVVEGAKPRATQRRFSRESTWIMPPAIQF